MNIRGKYIGLDIGSKKIGIAISDEEGTIAFPRSILKVDKNSSRNIVELYRELDAIGIVIGESKKSNGEDNDIMKSVYELKEKLEFENIPVILEREFFTSVYARQNETFNGLTHKRKENLRGRKINDESIDDKAAALILQRFLDRNNHVMGK